MAIARRRAERPRDRSPGSRLFCEQTALRQETRPNRPFFTRHMIGFLETTVQEKQEYFTVHSAVCAPRALRMADSHGHGASAGASEGYLTNVQIKNRAITCDICFYTGDGAATTRPSASSPSPAAVPVSPFMTPHTSGGDHWCCGAVEVCGVSPGMWSDAAMPLARRTGGEASHLATADERLFTFHHA